mmetsp:Transcript_55909/g.64569  ORF Transcript_55909/g.64569 Transcript_55909/m.64569 type:complete len:89 (-) Transcript_55909:219-485(-)
MYKKEEMRDEINNLKKQLKAVVPSIDNEFIKTIRQSIRIVDPSDSTKCKTRDNKAIKERSIINARKKLISCIPQWVSIQESEFETRLN